VVRKELEPKFGRLGDAVPLGSKVEDGELRTYFVIPSTRGGEVMAWYALDEKGGVAGAEVPTQPPTLKLVPTAGSRFVPDDPTGRSPALTISFADNRMTVTSPAGRATATR
jgi:hypothetical protein